MKKVLFLLLVLYSQLFTAKAQYVTIPDANFVTKLTQLFPSCMNGNQMDTTCFMIVNATTVDVANSGIYDLEGVQYFDNLINLYCDSNYLSTLPPLPSNLENLDCSVNQIVNISSLPPNLEYLYASYNQLTTLPTLPNLIFHLDCAQNNINNLPALPSNLHFLYCGFNELSNLPAVPNSLKSLVCNDNLLINIPTLPSQMTFFHCKNNQLTSLPTLPDSITSLDCSFNQLTSLPILPINLDYSLNCSHNLLTSLPALNSLQHLTCSYNQLTSLPTLPNSMYTVNCGNNQISTLPPLPNSLYGLRCDYNQLSSLPNFPNTMLSLWCSNNQLTYLSPVANVMDLYVINDNNISCLSSLPQVPFGPANISNNPLSCVPNQTNYSLGLPFCMDNDPINNPNNCVNVNIAGTVYTDQNGDCIKDMNDLMTENIPVKLYDSQNNFVALSYTANGGYSFPSLLPDTFFIKIEDNYLPVAMDCGIQNSQSIALDSINQTLLGVDFPVTCDAFDILIQQVHSQGMVVPGQVHRILTNITNNETWYNLDCNSSGYSGTVTINVTGPVSFLSIAPGALTPQINGNNFTYNVSDFIGLTAASFGLNFKTDTTANAGDQICVHVSMITSPVDSDTTNNELEYCYLVSSSYDPNFKEVFPVNVLPNYSDWFTYTIHFQNTGNAPAINIKLLDTLDTHLDLNTFEILGYSHFSHTSLNGHVLTVRFNNIMLPDSTSDYEGSMGYFQYRIKPLPNMPNGTIIENTAYIYFDYNAPIITNTTQNNFDITLSQVEYSAVKNEYILYPNPSCDIFFFKDTKNIQYVEVFNLLGEQIILQGNQKQINLSDFGKGIYYARINGETMVKLLKE